MYSARERAREEGRVGTELLRGGQRGSRTNTEGISRPSSGPAKRGESAGRASTRKKASSKSVL